MGRKMLLVASKNIRKGEEITDNYCKGKEGMDGSKLWIIIFHSILFISIQENFLFSCECEACEGDWPTFNIMPTDRPSEKVTI